jgi:hypothetical protein
MSYTSAEVVEFHVPPTTPKTSHCISRIHSSGIYYIHFLQASRQAVLEASLIYKRLRWSHKEGTHFNLLVDLRPAGFPSIAYAFNHCQRLFRAHPLPPNARTAYLLAKESPITVVVNDLYTVLQVKTDWGFFYGDKGESQALAFLDQAALT